MNNSAKTLFCRAAFVVLVLLPTFGTVSYVACGVWRPIEMTPAAWSSLLSEKTGLEIRIGRMRRDGTGVFVLEEFVIGDPESGADWITAPKVEVTVDGSDLRLDVSGMALHASAIRKLNEHLEHFVLKRRKEGFQPLMVHALDGRLLLSEDGSTSLPLAKLMLATKWDEHGPSIDVKGELIEEGKSVSITFAASRLRGGENATTRSKWAIDGEAGISTNTMACVSPEWKSLGEFARFWGQVECNEGDYVLSGIELMNVDLALLGERWGIEGMRGIAFIGGQRHVDAAPGASIEYRDGRFTDFFSEVAVESGAIEGMMLARLSHALGSEAMVDFTKHHQVSFSKGAARLELRGEHLRISGDPKTGAVLKSVNGSLVRLRTPALRNARELAGAVLSEVQSESLPVSQWVAAMPVARGAASASTARTPKKNKSL